jgi:homeobox-leucine zipper protein
MGRRERACSRDNDEEDGDTTRKKLCMSKEQPALLEEIFKEHNTLNLVYKKTLENIFRILFFKPFIL